MENKFTSSNRLLPYIPTVYRYLIPNLLVPVMKNQTPHITEYHWGGGRLCGKTFTAISMGVLLHIAQPKKSVGVYIIRKQIQNRLEAYNTALQCVPRWLTVIENKNEKTIKRPNFHMEIIGLTDREKKKVQKLGKTRRNHDIQLIIFDEAFEFKAEEFSSIQAALGSGKVNIIFKLANPFSPSAPFFANFLNKLPFETHKIKEFGHYFQAIGNELYHWVSPLAVWDENLLTKEDQKFLANSPRNNPTHGDTYLYGKPARLQGGIFTDVLRRIRKLPLGKPLPEVFRGSQVLGGLDIGYSIDKTAFLIGAISPDESNLIVISEFVNDSKSQPFDHNILTAKMMDFIENTWKLYPWATQMIVACDNDFSLVQTFNELFAKDTRILTFMNRDFRLKDLVYFERISKVYKKDRILVRVNAITRVLANEKLWVMNAPNLLQEMDLYEWDVTPLGEGKKVPKPFNDHSIDALSYMIRNFIHNVGIID